MTSTTLLRDAHLHTQTPLNGERQCADTTGTVLVPWAGHFQWQNLNTFFKWNTRKQFYQTDSETVIVWNYQNADWFKKINLLCHLLQFSAHFCSLWMRHYLLLCYVTFNKYFLHFTLLSFSPSLSFLFYSSLYSSPFPLLSICLISFLSSTLMILNLWFLKIEKKRRRQQDLIVAVLPRTAGGHNSSQSSENAQQQL